MSILNILVREDDAHVWVDTLCRVPETSPRAKGAPANLTAAKALTMPHIGVAIAGRGNPAFLAMVGTSASFSDYVGMDGLCGVISEIVEPAFAHYASTLIEMGERPGPQELAIVGWSLSRGAMHCLVLSNEHEDHPGQVGAWQRFELEAHGTWVAPWSNAWGSYPALHVRDGDALMTAAHQVEMGRRDFPGAALGGEVVHIHVERWKVSSEVIGSV